MATQSETTANERVFEQAANRIRDLNEQILENGRRAANLYLDLYERTLHSIADLQEQAAGASQVEFISEFAKSQARFTRDLGEAYASAARELLK